INKTAFDEAGIDVPPPDWNWDNFADVAKALTRKAGDEYEFFGCSIWQSNFPLQFAAMYQNGGALMNEEGTEITITRPESVEAVQWWADLFLNGDVSVTAEAGADANDQDLFVAQRVGMIHASSGFMDSLNRRLADQPFEWGLLLEPGRVTQDQWGATNYASVFSASEHQEEAFQAMSFWASPEAQIIMANNGLIHAPVRYGAYRDYMKNLASPPGVELHANQWDMVVKIPWRAPFEEQLFKVYLPNITEVWNGNRTAQEVFEEIEPQMNALFEA
ncbi:MAG: extracellular solute-binding protein, partial [Anaerolineae bacterium]|nr:extracellular solute-binding protein [Anaerolineae bacterium]NIN98260.1 extracellular solute-binding protein [Anaerolineae bacterium]NIQ81189.1 extracellular solute-binding protein [Anaerolineae bacterium]